MPRSPSRDLSDRYIGKRGYFRNPDWIRRWKYLLAAGAFIAACGWAAMDIAQPSRAAYGYTHGPLANPHAAYDDQCAACHTAAGVGIVGLFPRLSGAPLVQQSQATSLIRVVLEGSRAVATDGAPTGPAMPSFAWQLSDADVAAVVTYIRNAWGNASPAVSASEVTNTRQMLHRAAQAP